MWRDEAADRGFAIIPDVLARNEVASILKNLGTESGLRSRAGLRHALALPVVAALAWDPRLLRLAREILGKKAFPFNATLFDKSPDVNWLVAWHQDTALPLRERRDTPGWGPWSLKRGVVYAHAPASALSKILALRVHLDDSTAQNGPLRVLPGSHAQGVLTDDDIHQLASQISSVECVVSKGGIVAMRPLLIHASSKSRSQNKRRVLHIEYAASAVFAKGLRLVSGPKRTRIDAHRRGSQSI
jgi:ectoine hydroxylase-related dioxygenase (phytanoyl-CoA dioxygenase family)